MSSSSKDKKSIEPQLNNLIKEIPDRKKFAKKHVIILTLIFAICILSALFIYRTSVRPAMYTVYKIPLQTGMDVVNQINSGKKIEQKFVYDGEIDGIQLVFATYGRSNKHGSVIAQIWTNKNQKIAESKVNLSEIVDNQPITLKFGKLIDMKAGEKYDLLIKPGDDFDNDCSLAIYYSNSVNKDYTSAIDKSFTYDGKEIYGSLNLVLLRNNLFIKKIFFYIAGFVTLLFLLSYFIFFVLKIDVATSFLFFAFSIGVLYLFILPPISAPDEDAHFATTYAYTNYLFGRPIDLASNTIQETVNSVTIVNGEEHKHTHYRIPARQTDAEVYSNLLKHPNINQYRIIEKGIFEFSQSKEQFSGEIDECVLSVSPIAYMPGILGVLLARILGLGGVQLLLLGRFFNLLFYIFMVYFAIKVIPFGKCTLAVIALFPMTLNIVASFSYDVTLYASAFLFTALILGLAYGKSFKWYDMVTLIYCAVVFGSVKVIYMAMIFLVLIIPIENKLLKRKGLIILFILLAVALTAFSITTLGSIFTKNTALVANGENYNYQSIILHPFWFLFLCLKTFINFFSYYLNTLIGGSLGWLDLNIQWVILIGFMSILFLSMLSTEDKIEIKCSASFVGLSIFACIVFGAYVAALTWNPMGSQYIYGVQGRYFLPVLPLLLYGIQRKLKFICLRKDVNNKLLYSMAIFHILTLSTAFQLIISR